MATVTVHGRECDKSVFRHKVYIPDKPTAGNLVLPPPAAPGGQSHFRGGKANSPGYIPHATKIGTVPCERLLKDCPIYLALVDIRVMAG